MAFIQSNTDGYITKFIPYEDNELKSSYFKITKTEENVYTVEILSSAPIGVTFSEKTDIGVYDSELEYLFTRISDKIYQAKFWNPRMREYVSANFAIYVRMNNYLGDGRNTTYNTTSSSSNYQYNPNNNNLDQIFTYRV